MSNEIRIEIDHRGCLVLVYADGGREAFYDYVGREVLVVDPALNLAVSEEPKITLVWEIAK